MASNYRALLSSWSASTRIKPALISGLAVAGAALARTAVDPWMHDKAPFLFFAIAVCIAGLYGGAGAGLFATLLSLLVCDYFFVEPRHEWFMHDAPGDSAMLILFASLCVLVTIIIHRFKRDRQRLSESLGALEQSESKVARIAAMVPEILFTVSPDGAAEYFNARLCEFTGAEPAALAGSGWLDVVHPADRPILLTPWATASPDVTDFEATVRLRRADGEYRWFQYHAAALRDPNGQHVKWFGVCSNVHDRKVLEDELAQRNQELLQLNAGLERFAYTASHDLNEPLRTISASLGMFLEHAKTNLDEKSQKLVEKALDGARRMSILIQDILAFAMLAHSGDTETENPVDSTAAAQRAIDNLRRAIQETGATVALNALPGVCVNEAGLTRIFQNLIANAVKFRGRDQPAVHISATETGAEFIFAIQDNGIGIDPKYHAEIFQGFHRLHSRSEYEGSGIGLAACKRILDAYRGRIWVQSQPGSGSVFYFAIPKSTAEANQSGNPEPHRKPVQREFISSAQSRAAGHR